MEPGTGITLKEMARRLGLSPRSVSQALRNDGRGTTRVAAETIRRVQALAQEGGYRLNTSARALRTRRFRQAGILVRYDFENHQNPLSDTPAIFGLGDFLNTQGWHLVIVQDRDSDQPTEGVPQHVREHSLDGLVISSRGPEIDLKRSAQMAEAGLPHIWLNRNAPVNAIGIQDEAGAEMATRHLLELGHRRIVFFGTSTPHGSQDERERGYGKAMVSAGLEPMVWKSPQPPIPLDNLEERRAHRAGQIRKIMEEMVPRLRPTALVCYSDLEALTAIRSLLAGGLKIPEDISVIGYNDFPLIDNVYPPLTTMRADFYLLGRMAGEMLMEHLQSPQIELPSRSIVPQLIVRQSTGPVPRSAKS
jgi:DNA-binding LacI/PurR family transcriptional regulator